MLFLNKFDNKLTSLIRDLPKYYRTLMSSLTFVGEPLVVLALGFAGFVFALQRKEPRVERAFIYAAIAFGLNTVLKLILHRRRPYGLVIKTLGLESYSFPSGHAFGTVIFYGLFAYLDLTYLGHIWNVIIAGLLWAFIFLIGVSRVYLGAHYPSDVLAGWLLGVLSLAVIIELAF
jgi:undecaprenyl-diphosphatase